MTRSARISYLIMAAALVLVGWLHLGTLVLTTLFGYFAVRKFSLGRSKALGVALYVLMVAAMAFGLVFFLRRAYVALPRMAETVIPAVVDYAAQQGVEMPFTDYASLKARVLTEVTEGLGSFGRHARAAAFTVAQWIIGLVVAVSLFVSARWGEDPESQAVPGNLYATVVRELRERCRSFYRSFARVIGAQLLISAINTVLTAAFLLWNGFPHMLVLTMLTFLCGLLPIVGNILSNTLIVGVAFTLSPKMALLALIFLVLIHKLEYFLNSKIVGERIRNPMWLTLLGLVLGEKLMGIPGMILAPVVLHYLKVEASRNKAAEGAENAAEPQPGR